MDVQTRDPSEADAHISFHTKDVRVKEPEDGDDEVTRIEVPVSGLAEDRDGDKLADSAIDSMVAQINEGGVPMFANHGYDADNGVPQAYRFEDIIGGWSTAERDGDIVTAEADLREGHDSVEDLTDLFAQSMPVGFSIGFGWGEGDAEERESGGLRFRDVDLMEISPVGIQSHPDASTTGGMKVASALEAAGYDPADLDETRLSDALKDAFGGPQATRELTEEQADLAVDMLNEFIDSQGDAAVRDFESWLWEIDDDADPDAVAAAESAIGDFYREMSPTDDPVSESFAGWLDDRADGEIMTDSKAENEDEEDEEEQESVNKAPEEIVSVIEAHMTAMMDDVREVMEGDGEGMDEDEEDEEDEEKTAELESELEELKAELEAVKTDTAGTQERKGGMIPSETDDEQETNDETPAGQTDREFARNLV